MSPTPLPLSIDRLVKHFGDTRALDGVTLAVQPGEFVALLGPSGSGKSTLFRCVSGLTKPNAGSVQVLGVPMEALGDRELRRQRRAIGLIFQQFNLIGRRTALANVLAGRLGAVSTLRASFGAFEAEDRQLALGALDLVGLLHKAYQRADSLSGGQQQRVAIARVVAQQSRVVLADEPVASLDPAAAANVLSQLRSIARDRGIAVLCSLHQTDLALSYADRIVAMRQGRVVLDSAAATVSGDDLVAVYREVGELTSSVVSNRSPLATMAHA